MSQKNGLSSVHWRTPTAIIAGFILGACCSAAHHFFYRYLDGRIVSEVRLGQSQNVAVGNAFTFLVRAFLVMSITSTFWQVFWSKLHDKPITVNEIDALHGLLVRLEEFRHVSALKTVPNLALLALLSWLMPFAVVFPPSALSVESQNKTQPEFHHLGTPNWEDDTGKFALLRNDAYESSARLLQRYIFATAYMGSELHIDPIRPNASYSLSFAAPAVSCHLEDSATHVELLKVAAGGCESQLSGCGVWNVTFQYISWVAGMNLSAGMLENGFLPPESPRVGASDGGPPTIFIATITNTTEDWQVLGCQLHNASYEYAFSFEGYPTITLVDFTDLGPLAITGLQPATPPSLYNYIAMFETLGRILVGTIYTWPYETGKESFFVDHVKVLETGLGSTKEMIAIANAVSPTTFQMPEDPEPLSDLLSWHMSHLMVPTLFSNNDFLTNATQRTRVEVNLYFNMYRYNSSRLLIPYGAALAMAGIAVMIGLIHLITDGVSYSNRFSTVLRTTRHEQLDHLIGPADREGQDPIPQHLAKWRLRVGQSDHGQVDEMAMELLNDGDRGEAGLKSAMATQTERRNIQICTWHNTRGSWQLH